MKNQELDNLRHSAAHLLAAAVMEIWPDTKRTIGPAIDNGFYFDFEFSQPISEKDFPRIEQKMRELVKKWDNFERVELSKEDALKEYDGNQFKQELINEFSPNGESLSFYKSGNYRDLCKGGHIDNPKEQLKNFKLLSVAGAYWRGSEKNPMLTRIYGTAFFTKEELEQYLHMLEEAKKRDHKKLGRELDLFFFHETSPGMAYWLPKGLTIYNILYSFVRSFYKKYGYTEVATPMLNKKELYETSGHWSHYKDDMFISNMGEHELFGVKPMNCPNAMVIFDSKTRSYNDLPIRLSDTSVLHRYELSGTLNGLFRIRQFRQDDAHIFITPDQIKNEFQSLMKMVDEMYKPFGLSYKLRFGSRPEHFLGESFDWDKAEEALLNVLKESGKDFFEAAGEGAFYGPKVDILMTDSLGREWQTGTIQLDLQQPKRFGLKYIDAEGKEQTPFVFHRAIFGSIERFLGILVEHYAGVFPFWLSPIQVAVLSVAERHAEYAQKVVSELEKSGIRVELNNDNKTLGAKIRQSTLQKVPYMVIIGDKEMSDGNSMRISVRSREGKDLGQLDLNEFISQLHSHIEKYE